MIANGMVGAKMYDVVRVGDLKLIGEIIQLRKERAVIQVYEDTTGLRPGDPVENTGQALSVELGPGLLSSIYDGVQRPLTSGMAATVEIKTGSRRLVEYLFSPLVEVASRAMRER